MIILENERPALLTLNCKYNNAFYNNKIMFFLRTEEKSLVHLNSSNFTTTFIVVFGGMLS